jgi:hypothetical protein
MKLFGIKSKTIPIQNRKPNHDVIAELEKEFKFDAEGFNERYDKMLLDDFLERHRDSELSFSERIESMCDLTDSMYSTRYRLIVVNMIHESRKQRWNSNGIEYDELKSRMINRGKPERHRN